MEYKVGQVESKAKLIVTIVYLVEMTYHLPTLPLPRGLGIGCLTQISVTHQILTGL